RQPTHRKVSSGPSAIVTTIQTCSRSGRLTTWLLHSARRAHARREDQRQIRIRQMVGGPGFEPGASRSRTVEIVVQKRAKRSDPVRNVSRGPWSRPDSGQSSGGLLQKLLHDRLLSGVLCVWAHVNGLARDFGVSVESIKRQLLDGLLHHCSSDVSNPSSSLPARPVAGGYEGP